ncbi:hypothetical protein BU24DRAFT_424357, partial [Aaosphaeria arxii CBS 175.79]
MGKYPPSKHVANFLLSSSSCKVRWAIHFYASTSKNTPIVDLTQSTIYHYSCMNSP